MMRLPCLALAFTGIACSASELSPESPTLAVQEATIEFLSKRSTAGLCIRVASGPNEMEGGLVASNLRDPPTSMLERLKRKDVAVRAFSACEAGTKDIILRVGWPVLRSDTADVRADWLCGRDCGSGVEVRLRRSEAGWRAVGAKVSWIS
jgi:hypothetical protein